MISLYYVHRGSEPAVYYVQLRVPMYVVSGSLRMYVVSAHKNFKNGCVPRKL